MFQVQLAESQDIEEISNLKILQQKEGHKELYLVKDEDLRKVTIDFLSEHLNKDVFLFIVKDKNKIMGTCGIEVLNYPPQANNLTGKVGYISYVYTVKEYRNKGIQNQLLTECMQYAEDMGIKIYELSAPGPIAVALYKKFGFKHNTRAMEKGKNFNN